MLHLFTIFLAYLILVHFWRFKRLNSILRSSNNTKHRAPISIPEAHMIVMNLAKFEFPTTFKASVAYAMFRSYGLPSISHLLARTGHFQNLSNTSRRASDTAVLLSELFFATPGSERAECALRRINNLHDRHRSAGRIRNEDMLYTLGLSVLEPIRWIDKYEWRKLTHFEINALGVLWRYHCNALKISTDCIPTSESHDGAKWLEQVRHWSNKYEKTEMTPAETNRLVAESAIRLLLHGVPLKFAHIVRYSLVTFTDARLRTALMIEDPSPGYRRTLQVVFLVRKLVLRHLCLPRIFEVKYLGSANSHTGRYWSKDWLIYPWYVKPTILARYGPYAWYCRMLGLPLPGDEGYKYLPDGYLPKKVGGSGRRLKL